MLKKSKSIIFTALTEFISAVVITYSVVPGFDKIGYLFLQVLYTFLIVTGFLFIADSKKLKPTTVSHSLIVMLVYWIANALIIQARLHIQSGETEYRWHYIFYYDKPALLIVVFGSVFFFYAVKYILNHKNEKFVEQYRKFQKISLISFCVYYALIIVYCFFIIRESGDSYSEPNFIPFNVFNLMKQADYEYELIFLFVGNIAIFLPLGVVVPPFLKGKLKPIIFILPFFVSIGIETLQYFLKNGNPDIDDVILNVIGYFIGYFAVKLIDLILKKASKGECNSIFVI